MIWPSYAQGNRVSGPGTSHPRSTDGAGLVATRVNRRRVRGVFWIMTRTRWVLLITAVAVPVVVGALWWIATEDDRRLDGHIRQALEGYEQAFAREGTEATPTPLRRNGYAPFSASRPSRR